MSGRDEARRAALDALYAELPSIECRGKCWDSCGPIGMTGVEHRRLREAGAEVPNNTIFPPPPGSLCPALTMFNQCGVYEIRPLICRLWGLIEGVLPCTYGCRPDRYLTDAEAHEFIARAYDIDGQHDKAAQWRALYATPEAAKRSTKVSRALVEEGELMHDLRERRAQRHGTAVYVIGRGRFARRDAGAKP